MQEIDVLKEEMEYIAMQNNPFTAIGGGLRYLCKLRNVEYSDDEPDNIIRDRLLQKIENEKVIELPLNPDAKEPLDRKVWLNETELKPLEPFFCVEDNEKYERFVLEVNDTKIPVYIRPSDFKKLRGE